MRHKFNSMNQSEFTWCFLKNFQVFPLSPEEAGTDKLWKQPRCPTTDEWIKKIWCIYTQWTFIQHLKKNEIMMFAGT
jgi:hypothetical protein